MAQPRTIATEDEAPTAVRAVLIDPTGADTIHVHYVHLPTMRPGDRPGHGLQLAPGPIEQLRHHVFHPLHAGEWLLTRCDAEESPAWWIGSSGPHRGRGIVVQFGRLTDTVSDTMFALEQVGTLPAARRGGGCGMITSLASAEDSEAAADDAAPEVRLAAVLHVNGAELLASAGHATEQAWRDGGLQPWLLAGIKRSVASLNEALAAFEQETADV